jgi:heme-degrading monooxygenase HmoA
MARNYPFVAVSRFKVRNGMSGEVRAAFEQRPHLVDEADGFIRMEVLTPADDPDEFWLITFWRDEASFQTWHGSPAHRQSHESIPKGLKLDAAATQVRYFQQISD